MLAAESSCADCWPTLFAAGRQYAGFSVAEATYGVSPFGQSVLWIGTIAGRDRWESVDPGQFACPEVVSRNAGADGVSLSRESYWYSSAMFTDPSLWNPSEQNRREEPNPWVRPVTRSQVRFPSAKVVLSERAAHHGNRKPLWSDECDVATSTFADGHGASLRPQSAMSALRINADYQRYGVPSGITVPFSSPAWGALGRDQ